MYKTVHNDNNIITLNKRSDIMSSKHGYGYGGKGVSGNTHSQSQVNSYANQHNPNNSACQAGKDNHANQCNPNNSKSNSGK